MTDYHLSLVSYVKAAARVNFESGVSCFTQEMSCSDQYLLWSALHIVSRTFLHETRSLYLRFISNLFTQLNFCFYVHPSGSEVNLSHSNMSESAKPHHPPNPQAKGEKSHGGDFSYVGIDAILEQMRRKAMKQGFELNIMVVGEFVSHLQPRTNKRRENGCRFSKYSYELFYVFPPNKASFRITLLSGSFVLSPTGRAANIQQHEPK